LWVASHWEGGKKNRFSNPKKKENVSFKKKWKSSLIGREKEKRMRCNDSSQGRSICRNGKGGGKKEKHRSTTPTEEEGRIQL